MWLQKTLVDTTVLKVSTMSNFTDVTGGPFFVKSPVKMSYFHWEYLLDLNSFFSCWDWLSLLGFVSHAGGTERLWGFLPQGDNWGEEAEGVWKKGAWSRTYFRQKESLWHQGGDAMLACVEYSLEIWVKVPAIVFLGLECPLHVSPRDLAGL